MDITLSPTRRGYREVNMMLTTRGKILLGSVAGFILLLLSLVSIAYSLILSERVDMIEERPMTIQLMPTNTPTPTLIASPTATLKIVTPTKAVSSKSGTTR